MKEARAVHTCAARMHTVSPHNTAPQLFLSLCGYRQTRCLPLFLPTTVAATRVAELLPEKQGNEVVKVHSEDWPRERDAIARERFGRGSRTWRRLRCRSNSAIRQFQDRHRCYAHWPRLLRHLLPLWSLVNRVFLVEHGHRTDSKAGFTSCTELWHGAFAVTTHYWCAHRNVARCLSMKYLPLVTANSWSAHGSARTDA